MLPGGSPVVVGREATLFHAPAAVARPANHDLRNTRGDVDLGLGRRAQLLPHLRIRRRADLRGEVEEVLFEADDRVAVAVRNSGRGRASGAAAEGRYYVACVVRDGRIVAGREYATRDQALEGVRLMT